MAYIFLSTASSHSRLASSRNLPPKSAAAVVRYNALTEWPSIVSCSCNGLCDWLYLFQSQSPRLGKRDTEARLTQYR